MQQETTGFGFVFCLAVIFAAFYSSNAVPCRVLPQEYLGGPFGDRGTSGDFPASLSPALRQQTRQERKDANPVLASNDN